MRARRRTCSRARAAGAERHAGRHACPQAFLLRKLKINGSMGLALKLQPILDAAAPRAKL